MPTELNCTLRAITKGEGLIECGIFLMHPVKIEPKNSDTPHHNLGR
jgi:hypothetical protein